MKKENKNVIGKNHVLICNEKRLTVKATRLGIIQTLLFLLVFMCQAVYSQSLSPDNCIRALEYGAAGEFNKARLQFDETLASSSVCEYAEGSMVLLRDVFDGKVSRKVAIHIFRAWIHQSNEEFREMAGEGERAIQIDPNSSLGYRVRGAAYFHLGEYDNALRDIDRAIALNPNNPVSYNRRGLTKKAMGDINGALTDFNHAIELGYTEAYLGRVAIHTMTGDFEKGLVDANRCVELNPDIAEAWSGRAFIYVAKGNTNKAKKDLEMALSIEPENPEAWFVKCVLHYMAGDKAEAINAMHKFLKIAPPMLSAWTDFVRQKLRELEAD